MAKKQSECGLPKGFGEVRRAEGRWEVTLPKGGVTVHRTQREAIGHARKMVETEGGGLVVHGPNGSVKQSYTIGRAPFARIGLVEGITPSSDAQRRAEEFDRKGLASEERRRAIIEAYRKRG